VFYLGQKTAVGIYYSEEVVIYRF